MKPLLENEALPKLGHQLKLDAHILAGHGIALRGQRYDSMLESYVLDSVATGHDMDSIAEKYLGLKTVRYEDIAGKGAKQLPFNQIDVDRAAEYGAEHADVTLRLHQAIWPQLEAVPRLKNLYETIEQPLVPVLYRMERDRRAGRSGAAQDTEHRARGAHARAASASARRRGRSFQSRLAQAAAGDPVRQARPAGDAQDPHRASRRPPKMCSRSSPYPMSCRKLILEYRGVAKLKSTYTDKLPEQIDELTGRIHTTYQQGVAATGRLSSSDPNLQNIPIRTPEGRRIRQAFVAAPGYSLVAADYSQIELRIMAHLSRRCESARAPSPRIATCTRRRPQRCSASRSPR